MHKERSQDKYDGLDKTDRGIVYGDLIKYTEGKSFARCARGAVVVNPELKEKARADRKGFLDKIEKSFANYFRSCIEVPPKNHRIFFKRLQTRLQKDLEISDVAAYHLIYLVFPKAEDELPEMAGKIEMGRFLESIFSGEFKGWEI